MSAAQPLSPALVVSVMLHVLVATAALTVGAHHRGPLVDPDRGASWQGDTFEVDELLKTPATSAPAAAEPKAIGKTESEPQVAAPVEPKAEPKPKPDPGPKPEAQRQADPKPEPAAGPPSASRPSAGDGQSDSPRGGSPGVAPGVANLAKAFTRAITAATHRDAIWDELPLGKVGSFAVVVTLGDDGSITESELEHRKDVAEHLVRMVDRTLLMLKAGRFALSREGSDSGSESFQIDVVLSAGTPDEYAENPHDSSNMGFDPPLPDKPGRAYFDHASGRHFEAKVTLLPR